MSDEITPALTPDEWANSAAARGDETLTAHMHRDWPGGMIVTVGRHAVQIPDEAFHAVAALCLHGQKFGFTRADVALVRGAAEEFEFRSDPDFPLQSGNVRFLALADKLAALLPPEAK